MQLTDDTRNPKESVVWSTEYGLWGKTDPSLILVLPLDSWKQGDLRQFLNFVTFSRLNCKPGLAPPDKKGVRMK